MTTEELKELATRKPEYHCFVSTISGTLKSIVQFRFGTLTTIHVCSFDVDVKTYHPFESTITGIWRVKKLK